MFRSNGLTTDFNRRKKKKKILIKSQAPYNFKNEILDWLNNILHNNIKMLCMSCICKIVIVSQVGK